jgi:hypothetical protein
MVIIDKHGVPIKYNSVKSGLEDFYTKRLSQYRKRIDYKLNNIKEKIVENEMKLKYVNLVIDDKIVIKGISEQKVREQLDIHEIPYKYADIKTSFLNNDGVKKIKKSIKNSVELYAEYSKNTPEGVWRTELVEFYNKYIDKELKAKKK